MNRTKANELLKFYGRTLIKSGDSVISFARQNEQDISYIEAISDKELIEEWKRLVWLNEIYGQVSLNDMQRISLIELEFDDRKDIKDEDLKSWYDKELENFNIDDVK